LTIKIVFFSLPAITLSETNELAIFYGVATKTLFVRSPNKLVHNVGPHNKLTVIESIDLNSDGLTDLAVCRKAFPGSLEFKLALIFFNLGDERQFEVNPTFGYVTGCNSIVIGDFDNDGEENDFGICDADIGAGDTGNGVVSFIKLYNRSTGYPYYWQPYKMQGYPSSLIKGRFNDDDFEDLAAVSSPINTVQSLLAYGDGTFTQQIYPTANYPTSVTRINFNNDRIDDLAVLTCNQTVTIFLGAPTGLDRNYLSFETSTRKSDQCAHSLKVADLNRDGTDDLIFIDTETHGIGVLLGTDCQKQT
jgi:hypothetical protein